MLVEYLFDVGAPFKARIAYFDTAKDLMYAEVLAGDGQSLIRRS